MIDKADSVARAHEFLSDAWAGRSCTTEPEEIIESLLANCQRLQAIVESRDRDLDAQDVGIGYEVLQRREAKAYLTRLLAQHHPTCVPMDGLIGLCTQIDNAMTSLTGKESYERAFKP